MASSERVRYKSTAMDRSFGDSRIIAVAGPVARLDSRDIRTALTAATESTPTPHLALQPSDGRLWDYRYEIAGDNVSDALTGAEGTADTFDLGKLLTEVRSRPGHRSPLEAVVAGDYLALDFSHCLGDGQLGLMMLAALSSGSNSSGSNSARATSLAQGLPSGAAWTALRRHCRSHPAALVKVFTLRRAHKDVAEPAARPPRQIENWEAAKVSRCGYMSPAHVNALRHWTVENMAGATEAAVSVALWRAALAAEKVAIDPHIMILFNVRRYLSADYQAAHGNFAVGIALHLPEGSTSAEMTRTMKQVIESGWPAVVLVLAEIKDAVTRWRSRWAKPPAQTLTRSRRTVTEVPDRLRLAVSDLGKLRMFDHVEWASAGGPPQVTASLEPDGPDGVTMLVSELAGGRTYTASFCSEMVRPEVIQSALDRLCADPIGLLRNVET